MASLTTLAYDSFTSADGTDVVGHNDGNGFGQWTGFAGLAKIYNNECRGITALTNYIHSGATFDVNDVTIVGEITRNNATADDNGGGLRQLFRSNGQNKGAGHQSLYFKTFGNAPGTNVARLEVGRQTGVGTTDITTLSTSFSWVTDQTYRFGIYVTGSDNSSAVSVWMEDPDGSNHTDFPMASFLTIDYSANQYHSIDIDLSTSARTWKIDNLAIYDSYYTGLASLAGGNGGGGGGAGTITDAISVQAPAVSMFTVGPIQTYG